MNKTFRNYSLIWFICLALFNLMSYVTPSQINGVSKFSGSFWVGYIFITIAFLGNLGCSYLVFKSENQQKLFYNIPLIRISSIGLFIMLILGGLAMVIPRFLMWISVILCFTVLAFTAIGIISSSQAADTIENIDNKVNNKTEFIKATTTQLQCLTNRALNPEIRKTCEDILKIFKYSDPVSTAGVNDIEKEIKAKIDTLSTAVLSNDFESVESSANEIIILISDRSEKLKLSK